MKALFDQLESVRRELAMRRSCYAKWVKAGKMSQTKANHEIECFEAVEATIQKLLWIQESADEEFGRPTMSLIFDT